MKKLLAIISLTILLLKSESINAQKATSRQLVKITATNSRSVSLLKDFFTPQITKVILKQISEQQFTKLKMYCNEDTYPDCIKEKLEYNPAKPNEDASEALIKSLKLYRIATFDNIRNGENFGQESILIVPAKENKNIGGDCNFTKDFYIIIPTTAIKILKNK